jgi:hypothetical protein
MLQLQNNTPFNADFQIFPNNKGIDTLFIVVKATFDISDSITLSKIQIPIHLTDEYCGEPGQSSLKAISEAHIGKSATDILIYGMACSMKQQPTRQLDIGLVLGVIEKFARVYGNRRWENGVISPPDLFVNMPLVWERSYGGHDKTREGVNQFYENNPLGAGHFLHNNALLPNIESLSGSNVNNPSIGFGPIPPNWQARAQYAGTYNSEWESQQAPYLPHDFNQRFLNSAPEGQIYPGFIQGGEKVKIIGMHPDDVILDFNVPMVSLSARANISKNDRSGEFVIETISLYPNQKKIALTWRAAISCPKGVTSIKHIVVSLTR